MNLLASKPPHQSMNFVNSQVHAGALCLNNIAVKLLVTGSYEKALRTILDAVKAFSCSIGESSAATTTVQDMILRASKRLSKQQGQMSKVVTESLFYNRKSILLFNDGEAALRPARISLPEHAEGGYVAITSDHDLEAAIVLVNCSLAFYLLSKSSGSDSRTQDALIKNTYKMLDLADQVICRQFALMCDADSSFCELRLYSVARFVVATTIQIFHETGRSLEASSLQLRYRRLGEVMYDDPTASQTHINQNIHGDCAIDTGRTPSLMSMMMSGKTIGRPMDEDAVSSTFISSEIENVGRALQRIEQKQARLQQGLSGSGKTLHPRRSDSPASRVRRLQQTANELLLAQDVSEWMKGKTRDEGCDQGLFSDCKLCESLGRLLLRHSDDMSTLFRQLFEDEYSPLYDYVRDELVFFLREALDGAQYPERTNDLLKGLANSSDVSNCCKWLVRVECSHVDLLRKLRRPVDGAGMASLDAIVMELCRPFVERVRFHFLDGARQVTSRIDRLPEILFGYLREHIFAEGGAWNFLVDVLSPICCCEADRLSAASIVAESEKDRPELAEASTPRSPDRSELPTRFLNELIRIVQWVLGERNFFRHHHVAGPNSSPLVLCNAIQQLVQFDDFLLGVMREAFPSTSSRGRLLSLTDIFVAGDDDLLQWWLYQEREVAFNRLFEAVPDESAVNRVAPRAELFCALIVSIEAKASVFSFSGPYLSQVAAPLCVQFLDAVHESATDLKEKLKQRRMLNDSDLRVTLEKWIELINGTNLAARVLSSERGGHSRGRLEPNASHDIERFGRSLHNLYKVMIDDFCTAFVETLLMERAKFAVYLMRCPHLLGDESLLGHFDFPERSQEIALSPDLTETARILRTLLRVCDGTSLTRAATEYSAHEMQDISTFASTQLCEGVLTLVAEKLLEVAMNFQGMTPDLLTGGCRTFERDVRALFESTLLPEKALRLLDISRVMGMDSAALVQVGGILCGLAGLPAPLPEDAFVNDERLHEEATSMIRAKGFAFVEVEDIISVLNRRRDLRSTSRGPRHA